MIDPFECILNYLREDPTLESLVGSRIASKDAYGIAWKVGAPSIILRPDGGSVGDGRIQRVRVELRFFASTAYVASTVWKRVIEMSRVLVRRPVVTSEGTCLLYSFSQATAPSDLYDDQLKMDFRVAYFDAMVSEDAVA